MAWTLTFKLACAANFLEELKKFDEEHKAVKQYATDYDSLQKLLDDVGSHEPEISALRTSLATQKQALSNMLREAKELLPKAQSIICQQRHLYRSQRCYYHVDWIESELSNCEEDAERIAKLSLWREALNPGNHEGGPNDILDPNCPHTVFFRQRMHEQWEKSCTAIDNLKAEYRNTDINERSRTSMRLKVAEQMLEFMISLNILMAAEIDTLILRESESDSDGDLVL